MRATRAAIVAVVLTASAAAAEEFQVPLTVQESAGVQRKAEPVSGGLPLPKGRFRKDQAFAIARADGTPVPCQVLPLVVETDGTLRWVLVDFQDDLAAGAGAAYLLKAAKPAGRPTQTLKVDETPEGVTVDTGKIRFTVSRQKPFGLFDSVAVGGNAVVSGGEASYVQMQGRKAWNDTGQWQPRKFLAGPPETLRLWYAGPMRVTIEAAGHFAGDPLKAGYRAYLTAWAGQGRVHVKYSLTNSNPDQYTHILVGRSTVELKVAAGDGVLLGAARPLAARGEGWIHQGLRADGPTLAAAKAGAGQEPLWTRADRKETAAGWIAAGDPAVFVCDVLFSTDPPRRLAAGPGRLVLEPIAEPFDAPADARGRRPGRPWAAEGFWLFDCSHHTSEYLIDFAAPADSPALDRLAKAARSRPWALAPGQYYSACEALSVGHFGTLDDEKACYQAWGWKYTEKQVPQAPHPAAGAFVAGEDNHYESECDSVQGLLLMYLRTGRRGWFDLAEAWARYHMDLEAWRTDGWRWKDGAIWFPQGGPLGTNPVRQKWNFTWGPDWGERQGNPDCADLWRHAMAKSCYCHFYGSGLADWFSLTGDRDALEAAIDDVETKDDEFRRYRKFTPGKTPIACIRGFGRGFEVMMRVLMADPGNTYVADLSHLAARTLWQSPMLDERGFHIGRFGGLDVKDLSPNVQRWMADRGITFTASGGAVNALKKGGASWPIRYYDGTWMHAYVQNGADLYARHFDDEDMRDFTIAFAEMSATFMLSPKCHQTWYKTAFDVPDLGMVFDPWAFDHTSTTDGEGCQHSGYYTRFYPDACAKGYSWTGEKRLLEKGKEFWYYGSKREYQTRGYRGGKDEVGKFAGHIPPKDDEAMSVSRLFYEWSHPRRDDRPPEAVKDLAVRLLGDGKAEVRFTAPADLGGGRVARYQVKAAPLPIAPYEEWDYARDAGKKQNWWRAVNCKGEPAPAGPGAAERFVVTGVPEGGTLYFAVRSFDDSENRSAISNVATP